MGGNYVEYSIRIGSNRITSAVCRRRHQSICEYWRPFESTLGKWIASAGMVGLPDCDRRVDLRNHGDRRISISLGRARSVRLHWSDSDFHPPFLDDAGCKLRSESIAGSEKPLDHGGPSDDRRERSRSVLN